jgi:hypothetical protein
MLSATEVKETAGETLRALRAASLFLSSVATMLIAVFALSLSRLPDALPVEDTP